MPLETPTVDRSRIQGFGSEAAGVVGGDAAAAASRHDGQRSASGGAAQASAWDDILTTDILSAIGAASEDLSQVVSQMATNIRGELERVKSAFNCQAPERETLSAEQIVVDHAMGQVKSVLLCGAPDKADLAESEVVVTSEPLKEEPSDALPTEETSGPLPTEAPPELQKPSDLLDLSAPPPPPPPSALVCEAAATAAVPSVDALGVTDVPTETAAPEVSTDLFDLSEPTPVPVTVDLNLPAATPAAPADLFDLSEPPLAAAVVESNPAAVVCAHVPTDLFDLSEPPAPTTSAPLIVQADLSAAPAVALADRQQQPLIDLLDLSEPVDAAPAANQAIDTFS